MHGAGLIARVIEAVERDGWETADLPDVDRPRPLPPSVIAGLRLPGDRPLPPSLARWLEFDVSLFVSLGWISDPDEPRVDGAAGLGATARALYEDEPLAGAFDDFEALLAGECLPLRGGSDSRRLLYLGEPDSTGEYPVLVTDIDDLPYVAVMYPGLDVYLADMAGIVDLDFDTYTSLIDDPEYGTRMREHAAATGLGDDGRDFTELFDDDPEGAF